MQLSLRFQKTSSWSRKSSLLWLEGHTANKILISLQSLISCFLESPWEQASGSGCSRVSWRLYYLLCLSSCCQGVGVLPSLIFFVPRIRPIKIVSTGQVFSRFSRRLWWRFLSTFFLLLFPPSFQLLSPSMPLFDWGGHQLSISESCVWNRLPKIGTQILMAGTLCYA